VTPPRVAMIAILVGLSQASSAWSDTTLTFQGSHGVPSGAVYISAGKVRLESAGQVGAGYAVYDGARRMLRAVDERHREYYQADESTAAQLQGLISYGQQALGLLQGQTQELSPSQRQAVEEQLARWGLSGLVQRGERPRPHVVGTPATRTVNGIPCRVYRIIQGPGEVGEVCDADPGDVPVSAADFRTFKSLASFARELAQHAGPLLHRFNGDAWAYALESLQGLPIAATDVATGGSARLTNVSHGALAQSLFLIPDGYRRAELPGLLPSGG
jgi:hypothetical protein